MTNLAVNKTMTVLELAGILGVSSRHIQKIIKELANSHSPVKNSQGGFMLNEAEVTAIKLYIQSDNNYRQLSKVQTKLEKALIVKQAMELLMEDVSNLQAENGILKPKAERLELIAGSDGLILPREAGKIISGHPNNFLQWMVDKKILYRSKGKLVPYTRYQDRGYFEVKESFNEIRNQTYVQTYFTPKGIDWISGKYQEAV